MAHPSAENGPLLVVGIGASAGGLAALEQFFERMPVDSGLAFVIIQHLSPDFKSRMPELLGRHTSMPIQQVADNLALRPNNIYLNISMAQMAVKQGKLLLTQVAQHRRVELPIDVFFSSLAGELGARAAAVVLSGTGKDGSDGVQAIRGGGGMVVVQSPQTAQMAAMPQNAVDTGVVDAILPPELMPAVLMAHLSPGRFLSGSGHDPSAPRAGVRSEGFGATRFGEPQPPSELGAGDRENRPLPERADSQTMPSLLVSLERRVLYDYDALLEKYLPAGVLVDERFNILHCFGDVARFLRARRGRVETNILNMTDDQLRIPLSCCLHKVKKTGQREVTRSVRLNSPERACLMDVTVDPIPYEKAGTLHYHIHFQRKPEEIVDSRPAPVGLPASGTRPARRRHLVELDQELQDTRANLLATQENLQSLGEAFNRATEELQANNEQLQMANEELQTINEELQASNEELNSTNEELSSVSREFERSNMELKRLNVDHVNLLASIDSGIIFLDRGMRIRKFNPSISALFNLLPQDIGRPIDHIAFQLADQSELLADIGRVLSDGLVIEKELPTREGGWLLGRIMPYSSQAGPKEGVVITFTDISKVKAAELKVGLLNVELESHLGELEEIYRKLEEETAERVQTMGCLAESEARFRHFFEYNSLVMLLIDQQSRLIVEANQAAANYYGYPLPGMRGMPFAQIGELTVAELDRQPREGQRDTGVLCSVQHRRADGELCWVEVHSTYIVESGRPLIFAIANDVSTRQKAERELLEQQAMLKREIAERQKAQEALYSQQRQLVELNHSLEERIGQAVDELRQKDQVMIVQSRQAAMGEMIGNIAHQWRQPLNALGMLLVNIRESYHFNELDAALLENAVGNGNRLIQKMSSTISDFQNFFNPAKESVAFAARPQIREAINLVESSFGRDNIQIHLEAPNEVYLFGFPNEYSQVLLNLLSNARDAITASGASHGRIEMVLSERDGQGCIAVTDNGGGIPSDSLDRIFEPYYSTKELGTGIGLYMSKMIIERNMGGSIRAHNVSGGAKFAICTPLASEQP